MALDPAKLLYPFTTMNFAQPAVLLFPIVLLFFAAVSRRGPSAVLLPHTRFLASVHPGWRVRLRRPVLGVLAAIALVCLSIAAARPQNVRVLPRARDARNIMLAIDLSPSMSAEDIARTIGTTSRLDAVKQVVAEFIRKRVDDRIGLVVFGGNAYLQSPLTTDHSLLTYFIDRMEVGMAGQGTAIGDGLGLALKRIQEIPFGAKAIILLTDGVSNAGQVNPLKAAKVAADLRVKVHTIGIGSSQPVDLNFGGSLFGLRQGRVEFDEATLKEIARLTGGRYFSAADLEGLQKIYGEIDKLESSRESEHDELVAEELFEPFAVVGALALLLQLVLGTTVFLKTP